MHTVLHIHTYMYMYAYGVAQLSMTCTIGTHICVLLKSEGVPVQNDSSQRSVCICILKQFHSDDLKL